ncbi:hypothetical protein HDF16_000254 [Granulicella aggregans]|uniref:Uncharacterized protein n=1 Tax=Granulicella aggregans TaxID=474949 RepID=A0A7W7Z975_9BACT|nr:hypothetical protein [Granulicella aggregans]MBB5055585.1 hypothetical protein [Granulicella aggregans]
MQTTFRGSRWIALAVTSGFLGCGTGAPDNSANLSPLPPVITPASTTTYAGVDNPGYYSVILDDVQKQFSYQAITFPAAAQAGYFNETDGVMNFGNTSGAQRGLAVEQPGSAGVLRPGDVTAFPVPLVAQSDCFAIIGRLRYIYLTMGPHAASGTADESSLTPAYGTFTTSTSTDGKSWTFGDNHGYQIPYYGAGSAQTENGTDPLTYAATCASSNGVGTIAANPSAVFVTPQDSPASNPTFHFNPNGLFVEDRSPTQAPAMTRSALYGEIGMAVPNFPISTTDLATGTYRGLVYEFDPSSDSRTHAVSFTPPTDKSSTLAGGMYANDNLTQTPATTYTITLGTQDAALNGLFTSAQLSVLDPNGVCPRVAQDAGTAPFIKAGFNPSGSPVCLSRGVAIASKIAGKYVIYFSSYDASNSGSADVTQLIQFYLYQQ